MNKLLLTCVIKPYGITDDYGDSMCTMELMNNQITREQGIHSPRSNNLSFGLYLLAENIEVPTTVLDFPSWEDFTREIDTCSYSHIGITFIAPNVLKTRRMVQYIRERTPDSIIILGGHGTSIPDLKKIIDYDEICHGEGVSWLRTYFSEDPDKPVIHPTLQTSVNSYIYGAPIIQKAGIIISGVGCMNGCRFCSTSHKFDKKYTPFLSTGRDIFEACLKGEKELGVSDFGLMDENFCKNSTQAVNLLAEMEKENKVYTFSTFSSAEAVAELGVDFLVRLGVNLLWIGVESKENIFEKTRGIDLHALIADLQNHGISVLASSILFLEHHNKHSIHDDIDWAINLNSDLLQFMQLGPMPGTALFNDYTALGKILSEHPWPKRHGQDTIWFKHPYFTQEESREYLKNAFIKKYQTHGPSVLNMAYTAIKSYLNIKKEIKHREARGLVWNPEKLQYIESSGPSFDPYMNLRVEVLRKNALKYRPLLNSALKYSPNEQSARKSRMVISLFEKTFGPSAFKDHFLDLFVRTTAFLEQRKIQKNGRTMRQPPLLRVVYPDRTAKIDIPDDIPQLAVKSAGVT